MGASQWSISLMLATLKESNKLKTLNCSLYSRNSQN